MEPKDLLKTAQELLKFVKTNPMALEVLSKADTAKCMTVEKGSMADTAKKPSPKVATTGYLKPVSPKGTPGTSQPAIQKDDAPHAPGSPKDTAHDAVEESKGLKIGLKQLGPKGRAQVLTHLRTLKDPKQLRSKANQQVGK